MDLPSGLCIIHSRGCGGIGRAHSEKARSSPGHYYFGYLCLGDMGVGGDGDEEGQWSTFFGCLASGLWVWLLFICLFILIFFFLSASSPERAEIWNPEGARQRGQARRAAPKTARDAAAAWRAVPDRAVPFGTLRLAGPRPRVRASQGPGTPGALAGPPSWCRLHRCSST